MQTNNINIIAVYDANGAQIHGSTTIEAKGGSTTFRVRFQTSAKDIQNISTIKAYSFFFGDVDTIKNNIVARQGNILIVDTIFELKYSANTSLMRQEYDLDFLLEGVGIYYSTLNDPANKIKLYQSTSITIETAQLGNYTAALTRYLESDGQQVGRVRLGSIIGIQVEEVFLNPVVESTTGDFEAEWTVEQQDLSDNRKEFTIFLTKYTPNYSDQQIRVRFNIVGKSSATGKNINYTDSNLLFTQRSTNMNPDLKFYIPTVEFNYKGAVVDGTISYTQQRTMIKDVSLPQWVNARKISDSSIQGIETDVYNFVIEKNTGEDRYGVINILSMYDNVDKENKLQIIQRSEPNKTTVAVWEDMYCTFNADTTQQFSLVDDENDQIVYTGYAMPINGVCNVNFRDIINNYISTSIQFLYKKNEEIDINKPIGYYFSDPNSGRVFYVKVGDDIIQVFHVKYDWSFNSTTEDKVYLQNSIQGFIDYRQYCFLSRYGDNEDALEMTIPYMVPQLPFRQPLEPIKDKINNACFKVPRPKQDSVRKARIQRCNIHVNNQTVYTYRIHQQDCYKYCLYYVNKNGGIDWYLFKDTAKETRSLQYENAKFGDRQQYYTREITQKWTLRTELLKDWQSRLMPNIFESQQLYLHDLETDEIWPVNITDTTYDIKQVANNKKKFYNYTINVQAQQTRKIIG